MGLTPAIAPDGGVRTPTDANLDIPSGGIEAPAVEPVPPPADLLETGLLFPPLWRCSPCTPCRDEQGQSGLTPLNLLLAGAALVFAACTVALLIKLHRARLPVVDFELTQAMRKPPSSDGAEAVLLAFKRAGEAPAVTTPRAITVPIRTITPRMSGPAAAGPTPTPTMTGRFKVVRSTGELPAVAPPAPATGLRQTGEVLLRRTRKLSVLPQPVPPPIARLLEGQLRAFETNELLPAIGASRERLLVVCADFDLTLGGSDLTLLSRILSPLSPAPAGEAAIFKLVDLGSGAMMLQVGGRRIELQGAEHFGLANLLLSKLSRFFVYNDQHPQAIALHKAQVVLAGRSGNLCKILDIPILVPEAGWQWDLSVNQLLHRLTSDERFAPATVLRAAEAAPIELDIDDMLHLRATLWDALMKANTSPLSQEEVVQVLFDLFIKTKV